MGGPSKTKSARSAVGKVTAEALLTREVSQTAWMEGRKSAPQTYLAYAGQARLVEMKAVRGY
jgi:hypothetical protein